jgi:hypothetical protein
MKICNFLLKNSDLCLSFLAFLLDLFNVYITTSGICPWKERALMITTTVFSAFSEEVFNELIPN